MLTRSARPATLGLGLALALLLLGGCSWIKDPDAQQPGQDPAAVRTGGATGGVLRAAEPTALPTAFVRDESITFPEESVRNAATGDDVVLTQTASRIYARSLPDLETTYSLTSTDGDFTDLWVDAAYGEGYSLEVDTQSGDGTSVGRDQYTLQRFDLGTGEITAVAIATLGQDPLNSANDATARIVAVEDDSVVVDSWVPDSEGAHTALVLDLADESLAWRARPAQVLTATADVVILDTGSPDEVGRIEAREIGNGLRRWSALPRTLGASAIGTTDDSVLIARNDNVFPEPSIARLDLATGEPVGKPITTDAWDWACTDTGATIAICTLADGDRAAGDRLVGWDLEANEASWRLPADNRFAPIVTTIVHGLVYGLLDSGQGVVLDGITGKDIAGDTGAGPVAVNDYGGVIIYSERAIFLPSGTSAEPEEPVEPTRLVSTP